MGRGLVTPLLDFPTSLYLELDEKFEPRYAVQIFLLSCMLLVGRVNALDLNQREGLISGPHLGLEPKMHVWLYDLYQALH